MAARNASSKMTGGDSIGLVETKFGNGFTVKGRKLKQNITTGSRS